MSKGEDLKQKGMDQAGEKNEDFLDDMRLAAKRIARKYGKVTIEVLRRRAERLGLEPTHQNAWGCVFREGNIWRRKGHKKSNVTSARSRVISVWELR